MNIIDTLKNEIQKVTDSKNKASKLIESHNLELPQDEIEFAKTVHICETTLDASLANAEYLQALNEILDVIKSGETKSIISLVIRQKRDAFVRISSQYEAIAVSLKERIDNFSSSSDIPASVLNQFNVSINSNKKKAAFYKGCVPFFSMILQAA